MSPPFTYTFSLLRIVSDQQSNPLQSSFSLHYLSRKNITKSLEASLYLYPGAFGFFFPLLSTHIFLVMSGPADFSTQFCKQTYSNSPLRYSTSILCLLIIFFSWESSINVVCTLDLPFSLYTLRRISYLLSENKPSSLQLSLQSLSL